MPIFQDIMVQYKPGVSITAFHHAHSEMLALKTACLDPKTQTPYIMSLTGDIDPPINRHRPVQHGFIHAFTVEFTSAMDRAYFLYEDPAFQDFQENARPVIAKVFAPDYWARVCV